MQIMHFVAPLPSRGYKADGFQDLQVLRDRLSGEAEVMFHGQTIAQFEKRLTLALHQLIENRPSRWSSKCLEEITHGRNNRQVLACLSRHDARAKGSRLEFRFRSCHRGWQMDGRYSAVGKGGRWIKSLKKIKGLRRSKFFGGDVENRNPAPTKG